MSNIGSYDFNIKQGETFRLILTLKNDDDTVIDLTGYDVAMQIRENYGKTLISDLTISNGGVDISQANLGIITLNISSDDTKFFNFEYAKHDIRFIAPNSITSYKIQGDVTLTRSVTI